MVFLTGRRASGVLEIGELENKAHTAPREQDELQKVGQEEKVQKCPVLVSKMNLNYVNCM